jgi:trimeric autotransporter adhesin
MQFNQSTSTKKEIKNMTTLHLKKSIDWSPLRLALLLISLLLVPLPAFAGEKNTKFGDHALHNKTTGVANTAIGDSALGATTTGNGNTAVGDSALIRNTTGNSNIALGFHAGQALQTGNNNIDIGNNQAVEISRAESNTIRIGRQVPVDDEFSPIQPAHTATYIAGISGRTVSGGVAVYINTDGKLGTLPSSARFKDEIKPMDNASEAILALKPVTFRYKKELDPEGVPQFGLVAEDVAKVNPDLVVRDAKGDLYTVRYEAVNAMLLNEFLKEHQKVQRLEAALAAVNERLKAQDAKIEKVNAKVELTKPAPQTVLNQ